MIDYLEHKTVFEEEAIDLLLGGRDTGIFIDGTVGHGGHSLKLAGRLKDGLIISIDRDGEILEVAKERCKKYSKKIAFIKDNFKNLPLILNKLGISKVDGLLLDLGVSTFQLLNSERGFSFVHNGPLDMRMDKSQEIDAKYLVNTLSEEELVKIFKEYGEERKARQIAREIVNERKHRIINSTKELVDIILRVKPKFRKQRIHPATKVFMALRIAVNGELSGLDKFLMGFIKSNLNCHGRIVVITFHSLEDRIVKKTFNLMAGKCVCRLPIDLCNCPKEKVVKILKPFPVKPNLEDISKNRRMRSAKLRGAERIC